MTQPMPTLPGMSEQIARDQLLSELGRGSMGHVYLALDPNIDRKVALKIFLPLLKVGAAEQWELRQRFVFEARAAGQLNHPGIVTIFDADTDPDTGLSYLAMEWVNGPSLDDLIRESAPLAVERSISIVEEVAVALDAAHRQGLVHRDIKPANILLESDGRAKVTDFGIAKLASMSITTTGWIPGSPFYMSPEQIRNENIDRRSDLYALGAVLYQCLTGKLPFEAESLAALTHMILEIDPRPVRAVNPEVSPDLAAVIETALSKAPEARFDSGQEFARALELARAGKFRRPTTGPSISLVPEAGDGDGSQAGLAAGGGTGTIGLDAPVRQELDKEEQENEEHEHEDGERQEPELEEAEPRRKRTPTIVIEPEPPTRAGTRRPSAEEVSILDDNPPASPGARAGRILLAVGMVLALGLVAWGLRPVASEPTGELSPLARLLLPTPRFSADASPVEEGIELPGEPAEATPAEGPAEGVEEAGAERPAPPAAVQAPAPIVERRSPVKSGVGAAASPPAAVEESTPEPVAPAASPALPTPEPRVRATSKLEIVYRNRLKNATLSVAIDDERVYAGSVEMGGGGLFGKALGKNVWTALRVAPGEHVVDIRITGGEGKLDLVRQTTAVFEDGRTHRLRVSVTPFKKLKLSWKDSPSG